MAEEKDGAWDIKGGIVKRSEAPRGSVCTMCGKPSRQRICEICRLKVEAEAIHRKLETDKAGKRPE
jgi:hypothetical protein